jgi:hypothetical protein
MYIRYTLYFTKVNHVFYPSLTGSYLFSIASAESLPLYRLMMDSKYHF